MKAIIFASLALLLANCKCKTETEKTNSPQPNTTHQVVVGQVFDQTLSIEGIAYNTPETAHQLFEKLSETGAVIKLLGVYENSSLQNVTTITVPKRVQQEANDENIYRKSRLLKANEEAEKAYSKQVQKQIAQYLALTTQPPTDSYTDLQGCLELMRLCLNSPAYAQGYSKYLLITSDMRNDPKGDRHAPLKPIRLINTAVLIVRPALSYSEEELRALFPGSPVFLFSDVSDALTVIK